MRTKVRMIVWGNCKTLTKTNRIIKSLTKEEEIGADEEVADREEEVE